MVSREVERRRRAGAGPGRSPTLLEDPPREVPLGFPILRLERAFVSSARLNCDASRRSRGQTHRTGLCPMYLVLLQYAQNPLRVRVATSGEQRARSHGALPQTTIMALNLPFYMHNFLICRSNTELVDPK